ncbi:MAG TPA: autotransporter outer membrane beta-barrel domain-containing protein [Pseudomonas sp.]|uniref:autotransporter outer membrane beta-barrel domain-containing protein n=1 Tax=Pseudomonas sp. TaxID=306 RepID=UPI002ED81620
MSRKRKFPKYCMGVLVLSAGLGFAVNSNADGERQSDTEERGLEEDREIVQINGADVNTVVVDNRVEIVNSLTPLDSYSVSNKGTLNVLEGGVVDAIVSRESAVNINGGKVLSGIVLVDSFADVNGSIIRNEIGSGLSIGSIESSLKPGSIVTAKESEILGAGAGVNIGIWGSLALTNSKVVGNGSDIKEGVGITVASGKLVASERSYIVGTANGLKIYDGTYREGLGDTKTEVIIDNSVVEGLSGAAIKIGQPYVTATSADVLIKNGAELRSGNGNLLEVEDSSIVRFTVDDSKLEGNIVADENSTLDVVLQNNAHLSGNIINGDSVLVGSSASWELITDNSTKSLSLQNGSVSFRGEGFHTLSLGELSGSGFFSMRINLDSIQGDLLEVNGKANGNHLLDIKNTGVEVVSPEFDPFLVVHTEGGDAEFSLTGERVDLGAYSYLLEKQGTDWFIVGEGKTISPSTQSALALFNAAPAIWNSELATLRSRMGEVRGQEEGGGWIRTYGNRFNASTSAGIDYQQQQQGLSFGADAPIPVINGNLVLGLMGGYSKSDLDLSRGTSGTVNSYYVGAYGTWLFEEGYYLDGVLKLNKFRNESDVAMTDGSKTKGRYNNTGVGGSVEFGRHFNLSDDYFVEPYAQVSGVLIGGDSYTMSNGLTAKNSRTQSVLGKVGTTAGRNFTLDDGSVVQPYVRVAMAHEFARSNEVKVNDTRFDNNLFGSRAELGAGVAVSLSKRLQLHADFDYMKGEHVEQPWGANIGLKLAF